ncbi:hypothetical protein HFO06_28735 [Rhizobium leguminosarum]|uniref:hypothetical protein n=1 Tax=Rhizobium leguminosarum TaxID=384 RepID=UPI001C97875D|nr:hypothetical protein [Rhizobium leguminosarum]MBY5767037.1 hypothetical protein [Rhizobium leguminosarum]MBY5871325.1 hypothetical protein [Rhizobium leguminosarum]
MSRFKLNFLNALERPKLFGIGDATDIIEHSGLRKMNWKAFNNALVQAALRMVPILPANELYAILLSVKEGEKEVDKQVEEAVEALKKTSLLISELEQSLTERTKKLSALQDEYKKYSEMSNITKEQASALLNSIGDKLNESAKRERFVSFLINIIAGVIIFVLGIVFSRPITNLLGGLLS